MLLGTVSESCCEEVRTIMLETTPPGMIDCDLTCGTEESGYKICTPDDGQESNGAVPTDCAYFGCSSLAHDTSSPSKCRQENGGGMTQHLYSNNSTRAVWFA